MSCNRRPNSTNIIGKDSSEVAKLLCADELMEVHYLIDNILIVRWVAEVFKWNAVYAEDGSRPEGV